MRKCFVFDKWISNFEFDVIRCHVWGHFCLCYNGQKLINDKTCLQNFGIKDGDQVCGYFALSCFWLVSKLASSVSGLLIVHNHAYVSLLKMMIL